MTLPVLGADGKSPAAQLGHYASSDIPGLECCRQPQPAEPEGFAL